MKKHASVDEKYKMRNTVKQMKGAEDYKFDNKKLKAKNKWVKLHYI